MGVMALIKSLSAIQAKLATMQLALVVKYDVHVQPLFLRTGSRARAHCCFQREGGKFEQAFNLPSS
jgi:hypothetical protein